ncbi:hypothetical protein Syun_009693 [Stephania yunnanensis]|uniref:Uncharacterized protein n=1 Tax=Stephania yunnanensis TaxID=152371 RepID=A0AAP0KGW3_9MAGN
MYNRLDNGYVRIEFAAKVKEFISFAKQHCPTYQSERKIRCSCNFKKCRLVPYLDVETVEYHICRSVTRHFKETEFRRRHLEQENQDLLKSLKEFQESQIQEFLSRFFMKKLRNKLKSGANTQRMLRKSRAREVEWDLQMEELRRLEPSKHRLTEKTLEVEEIELGFIERLKSCLDENQEMRERNGNVPSLSSRGEQNLKKEMEGLLHIVEEKDKIAMISSNEIVVLDEELMRT